MLSKLDEFQILLRMDANYMPEEYGMDIFHYTSPAGLTSILFCDKEKTVLWASRYDCLNDMSEGSIVEDILHEVCDDLLKQGNITPELHKLFYSVRPARTILLSYHEKDALKITRPECNRYVCSFSKNSDSLAMWNYYSKGSKYEGFNIGFFPKGIESSLERYFHDKEAAFHIYPVIYDKVEQKRLVERLLGKLAELYSKDQESSIRCIISNRLLDWSLVFKSPYFQHEEEIRVVIDVAKREVRVPVEYRITAGFVVPYIKLMLDKSDVSYVNFGPLQCSEEQKQHQLKVMEEMMGAKEYTALIDYSKIPVRF